MSKPAGDDSEQSRNEEALVYEAVTRAVAKAGVFGAVERESLAEVLTRHVPASLGEVRERLVTAGVPEDVVDIALKAGIVARASAEFDASLESMVQALQGRPAGPGPAQPGAKGGRS